MLHTFLDDIFEYSSFLFNILCHARCIFYNPKDQNFIFLLFSALMILWIFGFLDWSRSYNIPNSSICCNHQTGFQHALILVFHHVLSRRWVESSFNVRSAFGGRATFTLLVYVSNGWIEKSLCASPIWQLHY
jgi:hypothetical protein